VAIARCPTYIHMSDEKVTANKVVQVTYSIHEEEGERLEHSDLPISFLYGSNSGLLPKVERALEGHVPGDVIEVRIKAADGFGEHDPNLTYTDDLHNVPPEMRYIGAEAEFQNDRGEERIFVVTRIEGDKLTLNGNHPFAGKTLIYSVKIIDVRDATPSELAHGVSPFGGPPNVH
jgi:FKBP-type peptidyl-prolyl cis-trans isomerase SlyD